MFTTIALAVLLLIGLGALFAPGELKFIGVAFLILFMIGMALTVTTKVEAKNVGVLTTFGKPADRTLGSGLHFKKPWQKKIEIDGTIQPDKYGDGSNTCDDNNGISVKIGDGSRACVTLANRWQVEDGKANEIYAEYRSDDPTKTLRSAVVTTQLQFAVQKVLADYNPISELEVIRGGSTKELNFSPDYKKLGEEIKDEFESRPGSDLVKIEDITVSYVGFSSSTQSAIDSFIKEVGRTRTAAQAKATAIEVAEANKTLAASVNDDPGVAQLRCLEMVGEAIEKKYALPGGFNCVGGGGSVVLPTAK